MNGSKVLNCKDIESQSLGAKSAERADRVILLHDGRIVGDGTHVELIESSPRYGELVRVWERGIS